MKTLASIKVLADLALRVPDVEPLVIYDAVAHLARVRGPGVKKDEAFRLSELALLAEGTAKIIRRADDLQLEFKELVSGGQPK